MIPTVISDKEKIRRCNFLFKEKLNCSMHEKNEEDNRFWNAFGIGKPKAGQNNSITGEINFPFEGINRRTAGAFAEDNNGNILVLHRGKIGGGKKGIGKDNFINHVRGVDFVTAIDGNIETEFCLIGELNSKYFSKQVAIFIKEISRIKRNLENEDSISDIKNALNNFNYTSEHSGQSTSKSQGDRIINRTHGIVVDALAKELEKRNCKIGSDKNRDLFVHEGTEITMLFEVKTNNSIQDICTAVGQLIVYSIPVKNKPKLVMVFPKPLSIGVTDRLLQLGIVPLYYSWVNEIPTFVKLNNILKE